MKSIWILNHYAILPQNGGGTRHYDFASELVRRGYEVSIFASAYNHFTKKEMNLDGKSVKIMHFNGIRYIWLKTYPQYHSNGIKRIYNMISYYKSMIKKYKEFGSPDIVIGSSVHLFACMAGLRISKNTGAQFISEIRDLWPQTLIDMGKMPHNHPLAIYFRMLERIIYKKSDKIITLLPEAKEYIKKFKIPVDKIYYIPNGVNIMEYDVHLKECQLPINDSLIKILNEKDNFCCMYTGSHGIANNLDVIIQAAEIVQGKTEKIKFIFIGEGTEKQRLKNYCESHDLKNVIFHEIISKKYVPYLLSCGNVNLVALKDLNLYRYGISFNKIFDYMYSGKPTIVSGKPINNIVDESKAGITVDAENPTALAEAIIDIYNMNEKQRQKMGINGKSYIVENHNITKLVDKLEGLFRK